MKTKIFPVILMLVMAGGVLSGQGFVPPAEGKAVVYFARISSYGFAASFEFFHQDKYIGSFSGQNYMRYECDPGEQLFWASSENKEFITSDLEPGGSYIILVDVIIGFWKAHVGFTPISIADKEQFERAKELILKQPPISITDKEIEKMNKKLAGFMQKELEHYQSKGKEGHNFKHISADMAIPEGSMH